MLYSGDRVGLGDIELEDFDALGGQSFNFGHGASRRKDPKSCVGLSTS